LLFFAGILSGYPRDSAIAATTGLQVSLAVTYVLPIGMVLTQPFKWRRRLPDARVDISVCFLVYGNSTGLILLLLTFELEYLGIFIAIAFSPLFHS